MDEIMVETAGGTIPMWVNVFVGVVGALGGWEATRYILSLRANRRKDKAEACEAEAMAHQQAATAGQQDADWRQKELELMTRFVETAKQQYDDLTRRYDELMKEKEEDRKIKTQLRQEMKRYVQESQEMTRKLEGLQRAFTEEVSRRKAVERLYCSVETCRRRIPPVGEFSLDPVPVKGRSKRQAATAQ